MSSISVMVHSIFGFDLDLDLGARKWREEKWREMAGRNFILLPFGRVSVRRTLLTIRQRVCPSLSTYSGGKCAKWREGQ